MASVNALNVGLFSQPGYISINDSYKTNNKVEFNAAATKGKQMLPGGLKSMTSTQAGYFNKTFERVMTGEGYSDPVKRRRQEKIKAKSLNVAKSFLPTHIGKDLGGAGNHFGTFQGKVDALSPVKKPKAPYKTPGKNVLVIPPKKGTGYGYVGVAIGTDLKYASEPYEKDREVRNQRTTAHKNVMVDKAFISTRQPTTYFDPNSKVMGSDRPLPPPKAQSAPARITKPFVLGSTGKKVGGGKHGTFTKYPSHSNEDYRAPRGDFRNMKTGSTIFKDSQPPKSMTTNSISQQYIDKTVNKTNFMQGLAALTPIAS